MPLAADTWLVSLGEIAEAWRDVAKRRRRRVVIVTGRSGTGKSRLVASALSRLAPAPTTTLIGHGSFDEVGPYDWTATAFAGIDINAAGRIRSEPAPTKRVYLRRMGLRVPGRREPEPDENPPVSPDALAWLTRKTDSQATRIEPTALRRAAIAHVRQLAGDQPTVIVADNADTLDPASLDLLTALAVDGPTALIIVVARDTEPDGPNRRAHHALRELSATPRTTTIAMPDSRPPSRDADELIAWARYAAAVDDSDAPAAALDAAAVLLRSGQREAARELLDACLVGPPEPLTDRDATTRLALARTLLALGHVESAGRVADQLADEPGSAELSETLRAIDEITSRERDVLDCIAAGMTNQQTATTLGISIRTVTVHVSNVLRKTGTGSRTEAALWAVQNRLARSVQPSRRQ